jgi:beta-lactamase regulating signal transducer with metallopeptidase domain
MIASWMVYCLACAGGLSLAAVLVERALLLGRGPVRHVWVAAVVLSIVVPGVAFRFAQRPVVTDVVGSAVPELPRDSVAIQPSAPLTASTPTSPTVTHSWDWRGALTRADAPLAIAWLALSLSVVLYFLGGTLTLVWMRRRWEQRVVAGVPVLVSDDVGPALIAGVAPAIVVPRWALEMEPSRLALMLRHEQEHARVRDGQLLFAAQFALAAMPWNAALWWQLRRLRVAVELDCDARVLASTDARTYGDLLLEVVRPGPRSRFMVATAFAERATQLERRIRVMTSRRDRLSRGARIVVAAVGLASATAAWVGPRPSGPIRHVVSRVAADSVVPSSSPTAPVPVVETTTATPKPAAVRQSRVDSAQRPVPARTMVSALPRDTTTRADTNPVLPRGERGGRGFVGPGDSVQVVESIYRRLFDGIALTPEQEATARALLAQLQRDEQAQADSARPASLAFMSQRMAVQGRRDSLLLAMLPNDSDRLTVRPRMESQVGGQRGGAPVAAGGQRTGGRSGPPPGVGRSGGRGVGNPPDFAAVLPLLVENVYRRLFDGVTLTPDQEANARSIITNAQTALNEIRPPVPPPAILRELPRISEAAAVVSPSGASSLLAIVGNDTDREKLRRRLVVGVRPFPLRPPQ